LAQKGHPLENAPEGEGRETAHKDQHHAAVDAKIEALSDPLNASRTPIGGGH